MKYLLAINNLFLRRHHHHHRKHYRLHRLSSATTTTTGNQSRSFFFWPTGGWHHQEETEKPSHQDGQHSTCHFNPHEHNAKDGTHYRIFWTHSCGFATTERPLPATAIPTLMEKLEKAEYWLRQFESKQCDPLHPNPLLDQLIHEHWRFRLHRRKSSLHDGGIGLFLVDGQIKKGEFITCFPGLIYQIPYDLEACMLIDQVTYILRPPDFLVKNDYLLRFHHHATNQHLLVDGCPRGISALNYIKANQRRARLGANLDWLESNMKACGLAKKATVAKTARSATVTSSSSSTAAAGAGGNDAKKSGLVEDVAAEDVIYTPLEAMDQGPQYLTAYLGMGHMINDPEDTTAHNAEFHLIELPKDLPCNLSRLIPNVHFSDRLGHARHFTVLVTATKDLEVSSGSHPIELFVPYHPYHYPRFHLPYMRK